MLDDCYIVLQCEHMKLGVLVISYSEIGLGLVGELPIICLVRIVVRMWAGGLV
uniref:Uncharacterized protein n=1 Tax=Arundo donax TaxID=35708 RepID=A0A0A8YRJ0_ARUDO